MFEAAGRKIPAKKALFTSIAVAVIVFLNAVAAVARPTTGAGDLKTMSNLTIGMATARTYFSNNNDSYTGFNAAQAQHIQPNLNWADGNAVAVDVVNITGVNSTQVLLESLSASGKSFCIADDWTRQVV